MKKAISIILCIVAGLAYVYIQYKSQWQPILNRPSTSIPVTVNPDHFDALFQTDNLMDAPIMEMMLPTNVENYAVTGLAPTPQAHGENGDILLQPLESAVWIYEYFNVYSFEEADALHGEQLAMLDRFGYEPCYFKPVNLPDNMEINSIYFCELGIALRYQNHNTGEELLLSCFPEDMDSYTSLPPKQYEIIQKDGIDYHCELSECNRALAGHYIKWVEDGWRFELSMTGCEEFDSDVLEYCELVKCPVGC